MSKYRTKKEELEHLREQQERLREKIMAAEVDVRKHDRKEREHRLITAAARIEEVVREAGFPDWEISYPTLTSKTKERYEREDNVTMAAKWIAYQLTNGAEIRTSVPGRDEE